MNEIDNIELGISNMFDKERIVIYLVQVQIRNIILSLNHCITRNQLNDNHEYNQLVKDLHSIYDSLKKSPMYNINEATESIMHDLDEPIKHLLRTTKEPIVLPGELTESSPERSHESSPERSHESSPEELQKASPGRILGPVVGELVKKFDKQTSAKPTATDYKRVVDTASLNHGGKKRHTHKRKKYLK